MKTILLSFLVLFCLTISCSLYAQKKERKSKHASEEINFSALNDYLPVRSFYVALPTEELADEFISFVKDDLIPGGFNNLIVRVNWTFPFQKHPELTDKGAWKMEKIKELVNACRQGNVTLVPMINLLGHQSWQDKKLKLLQVYPEFDERPYVQLPAPGEWKWPNPDMYYCKSYCPNHPDVHPIVFACVDEVMNAFETNDFHAGMDEVFDLADPFCPRCRGLDPAEVFAKEINTINAHLKTRGGKLWIWADRLIDGRDDASGYGEFSASLNNTHRAIDMVDKDVVMCDWHYRVAEQSAVLFALKGYKVITCGWVHSSITERQLEDLIRYRMHSSKQTTERYLGFMQTIWSPFSVFLEEYRKESTDEDTTAKNYIYLKQAFKDYAKKLANVPLPLKDGRQIDAARKQ